MKKEENGLIENNSIKSKMKILLVYPKYPETFWSLDHALKFISKKAAFPPLGLMTIAPLLPKEWNKKIIDMNINELTHESIMWADMIFISAMIIQKESVLEVIKKCKSLNKKIVVGGPLFTTGYENFKGIDHFILGEAEITLPMFLEDLKNGNPKQVYTSTERPDIKKTPIPTWSLINFKDYASMPVQYSRGCPFNCEFCDIVIMNGRIPRTKSSEQMINEFQSLFNAGWRGNVFVVDDNFIGNKENVKKMLAELIIWQKKNKYPFKLTTEASVNLADDEELMQMMSAANFNSVFLGLETPSLDSLQECNKLQNTKGDISESIKKIQRNGLQVTGGFIVGFDSDKETIFEAQIKFIQQTGVVTAMVGILNALPQTRLWHRLKAEKRLINDTTGENTDGNINFLPIMHKEKLIEGYKKIISSIYSSKNYYKRIDTFIRNYKPTAKSKFSITDLIAFLKSTWKIGVLSRSRLRYWRLLSKTSIMKPKALPIAVELAIYGQHFQKVTDRILAI